MLRLIGLVVSIGLADSMNPSTIAPGLYLATGQRPRRRLVQFTLAVFVVNLAGGAVIALGPGEVLLALVPHPSHTVAYIAETVAGAVMLAGGVILWRRRERLARRELPTPSTEGKSSAVLGATIAGVELPTAFPYFAAIAAIVGSGFDPVRQLALLALFNLAFILPLLLIIATIQCAGDQSQRILGTARDWLQKRWPVLLAVLAVVAGVFVTLLGVTGLVSGTHGTVGKLSRRFRRALHH